MHQFKLPDIGEGLSEAELLEWLVEVGDEIQEGQDVASISTDKVNVDLPSPRAGVVAELHWQVGDTVPVGAVFMDIADAAITATTLEPQDENAVASKVTTVLSNMRPSTAGPQRLKASPALRRYARERNVDLNELASTAGGERLTRADVNAHIESRDASQDEDTVAKESRFKLTGGRLYAAKQLAKSSRTLATTTQTFEVFGDDILRESHRLTQGGSRVSPLAVIATRVARVLLQHEKFNANIDDTDHSLLLMNAVNLAVAVDTENGLMVPVIHDVADMDAATLTIEIGELAVRAQSGTLSQDDVRGASFTLSSTGGLERATLVATTPVVNLPCVAILWVSRIADRPRVLDGALEVGPVMACTLSYDHRYIHGAEGVRFINALDEAFRGN